MRAAISKWYAEWLGPVLAVLAGVLVALAFDFAYRRAPERTRPYLVATAVVGFAVILSRALWLLRRERGRRDRALAELGEAQDRLRQRLPEQARELLDSRPRTFYFLDHDAVSGLYAQIRGKLQVVEVREIRKRDARVRAKLGGGAAGIGADLHSAAERENHSAAVASLAPEFNEVLEHLIVHGQIEFGLDQIQACSPEETQIRGAELHAPSGVYTFPAPDPDWLKSVCPEAVTENGTLNLSALPAETLRKILVLLLTEVGLARALTRLRGATDYVFLNGEYGSEVEDDTIRLFCHHPQYSGEPDSERGIWFAMSLGCSSPALTAAGRNALRGPHTGRIRLRVLAKVVSWDEQERQLEVVPIAIF